MAKLLKISTKNNQDKENNKKDLMRGAQLMIQSAEKVKEAS